MSFIIEISTCGSVTTCTMEGQGVTGQIRGDLLDCTGSGDCEPACQYILDEYEPEFRIVKKGDDGKYANVIADETDKTAVLQEIYGDDKPDDQDLYLVWEAAHSLIN